MTKIAFNMSKDSANALVRTLLTRFRPHYPIEALPLFEVVQLHPDMSDSFYVMFRETEDLDDVDAIRCDNSVILFAEAVQWAQAESKR